MTCLVLLLLGPLAAWGDEPDVAALARRLDADAFAVRERAEQALLRLGEEVVDRSLADVQSPPEGPYGTDLSAYFAGIAAAAGADLKRRIYDRCAGPLELEGRFRLDRIRRTLAKRIDERILPLRAKYPTELPADQAKLVHGYTGGFRGAERWFDASYRNGSKYVVTAVRIQVRLEHKGKKIEQQALLGAKSKPIPPGGSATWSAEIEQPRGASYDFFWQTVAVYGYQAEPDP